MLIALDALERRLVDILEDPTRGLLCVLILNKLLTVLPVTCRMVHLDEVEDHVLTRAETLDDLTCLRNDLINVVEVVDLGSSCLPGPGSLLACLEVAFLGLEFECLQVR